MPTRHRPARALCPPLLRRPLVTACLIGLLHGAHAATYVVSTEAELRQAILDLNATAGAHFIDLRADIVLTGSLPPLLNTVSIRGNHYGIDGQGQHQLLIAGSADGSGPRILVQVSNLTLSGGLAAGEDGTDGGGGALGAGGALLVNSRADVMLSNVSVLSSRAEGGDGATGLGGRGGGFEGVAGGAGDTGDGSDGSFGTGGGSGQAGVGGDGGFGGGGGAGALGGGDGGTAGGAGGMSGGGGGGGLGGGVFVAEGGSLSISGNGRYANNSVVAGSGAGDGGDGGTGGTGIFLQGSGNLILRVKSGETLALHDSLGDAVGEGLLPASSFQQWNLVVAGGGPTPVDTSNPNAGVTYGTVQLGGVNRIGGNLYVEGANVAVNSLSALGGGGVVALNDGGLVIADGMDLDQSVVVDNGGGRIGVASGTARISADISGSGDMVKIGQGVLELGGSSNHEGAWRVFQGALALDADSRLGNASLLLDGGGVVYTAAFDNLRNFTLTDNGGFIDNNGFDVTLANGVTDWVGKRLLIFSGAGTTTLAGPTPGDGDTLVQEGRVVGAIATGELRVEGGATYDLGGANRTVAGLAGAGTIALGGNRLTLDIGVDEPPPDTLFAGSITGTGSLSVVRNNLPADFHPLLSFSDYRGLRLEGTSSYSGGTRVGTGALLSIAEDASMGTGALTLAGGAFSSDAGATTRNIILAGGGGIVGDLEVNGVISGAGNLVKFGAGTLTLNSANTFTGSLMVFGQGSYAALGHPDALGAGTSLQLLYGGGLRLLTDTANIRPLLVMAGGVIDTGVYTGRLAGSVTALDPGAVLRKEGSGTLVVASSLSLPGGVEVAEGTLQVGEGGTTGSVAGVVTLGDATALVIDRSNAYTLAADVAGSGQLVQAGSGSTTLAGNNTHGGGTRVQAGSLGIDGDARLGSGTLLLDGGLLRYLAAFDDLRSLELGAAGSGLDTNGFDVVFASAVMGSGTLGKYGAGRLAVTGNLANSVHVVAGELQVGDGGDTGSLGGDVTVEAGATLSFLRSDDTAFSGALAGSGTLRQRGGGELRLDGDSGAFTGTSVVDAGRLRLDGTLGGDLALATATVFSGAGTLLGSLSAGGGQVQPGNGIGTLRVEGGVTLSAASTLMVEFDASAADRLEVGGVATLGGTLKLLPQPADYRQAGCCTFDIVRAASVTGAFAEVVNDLVFLDARVLYRPDAVQLVLGRNATSFAALALSQNQQQVAGALESLEATDPADPLIALLMPLTAAQARAAYTDLSGDSLLLAANAGASAARHFRQLVAARGSRLGQASRGGAQSLQADLHALRQGRLPSSAEAAAGDPAFALESVARHYDGPTSRVEGVWVEAVALDSHESADSQVGSASGNLRGELLAIGMDGYWSDALLLGFAAGSLEGDLAFDNRAGSGTTRAVFAGSYGKWDSGGLQYKAAFTLAQHEASVTRRMSIGATTYTAQSAPSMRSMAAGLEAGVPLIAGAYALRPHLRLDLLRLERDSFSEGGAPNGALKVDAGRDLIGEFGLGVELARPWLTEGGRWAQLQGAVTLLEPFGDTQRAHTARLANGGTAFTVRATPDDSAALQLALGAELYLTTQLAVRGGYEGRVSGTSDEHNAVLGLQYRW